MAVTPMLNRIDAMAREALVRRAGEYDEVEYHTNVVYLPRHHGDEIEVIPQVTVFAALKRDSASVSIANCVLPIEVCFDEVEFGEVMDVLWDKLMVSTFDLGLGFDLG